METDNLEDVIARELCDVLDEPEAYLDCVLAINKKTHEVKLASPDSLTKEFDTYPIDSPTTTKETSTLTFRKSVMWPAATTIDAWVVAF